MIAERPDKASLAQSGDAPHLSRWISFAVGISAAAGSIVETVRQMYRGPGSSFSIMVMNHGFPIDIHYGPTAPGLWCISLDGTWRLDTRISRCGEPMPLYE